jgi:hypothetical protein
VPDTSPKLELDGEPHARNSARRAPDIIRWDVEPAFFVHPALGSSTIMVSRLLRGSATTR